ncbi:hypothetical protein ACFLR5_00025 [Elusimicrobiota bacterium]
MALFRKYLFFISLLMSVIFLQTLYAEKAIVIVNGDKAENTEDIFIIFVPIKDGENNLEIAAIDESDIEIKVHLFVTKNKRTNTTFCIPIHNLITKYHNLRNKQFLHLT